MEPGLGQVDGRLLTRIRIGTSGWSYPEWVGSFYPHGTRSTAMLSHYASRFRAVEAHSTHRRLPTPSSLHRWVAQVPADFRFATKAHVGITHRRDLDGVGDRMAAFFASLAPLGERLGPVLFLLPHRHPDLGRLETLLAALPAPWAPARAACPNAEPVFELAPAWWVDDVFERLAAAGAALAVVDRDDSPAQTPAEAAAGRIGYFRLRRSGYTSEALAAWARRLTAAAQGRREVYAFLKHDEHGDAPRYARALVEHLERT